MTTYAHQETQMRIQCLQHRADVLEEQLREKEREIERLNEIIRGLRKQVYELSKE